MSHLFISYKREDQEYLHRLINFLKSRNIPFWADVEIEAGLGWREEIDKALDDAFAVAVIVTPNIVQSQYVTYEWSWAIGHEIPVLPLLFEDIASNALHAKLSSLQLYRCVEGIPDDLAGLILNHSRPSRLETYVNDRIVSVITAPCLMLGIITIFCDDPIVSEQEKNYMTMGVSEYFGMLTSVILPSIWLSIAHSFTPHQAKMFKELVDQIETTSSVLADISSLLSRFVWFGEKAETKSSTYLPKIRAQWHDIEDQFWRCIEISNASKLRVNWSRAINAYHTGDKNSLSREMSDVFACITNYSSLVSIEGVEIPERLDTYFEVMQRITGQGIALG